jgi:predicted amidohydrolase YtcJ
MIDLQGRTLIPGFNDNHIHTAIGGDHAESISLRGLSTEEILEVIRQQAGSTPKGRLITAFGWDYPDCPEPSRALLDAAAPDHPVILYQFGGHGTWVNSRALLEMKIDRDTPDPPEGTILRDADGEPTGILREIRDNPYLRKRFMAMQNHRPTVERYLSRMMELYGELGITSVQDNTWFLPVFKALAAKRKAGELTTRFNTWFYGEVPAILKPMEWAIGLVRFDPLWVTPGPYKYFLDGTFSTRSAWLTEPYTDEPNSVGKGKRAEAIVADFLARRVQKRQRVACHAIGDRAVKEFLDAVELVRKTHPWAADLGHRVEHAQLIRPEDIPRLRELGVSVSAQPHAMGTPEKDLQLLGPERVERAYPYRWLLDEGVNLSFGSDYPGEPTLDPLLAMRLMVDREGPQRISPEEALYGYTMGSARAEGKEEIKGSLETGKLADLAVLSADPLSPGGLHEARVELTFCGGKVVHDRAAVDQSASATRL